MGKLVGRIYDEDTGDVVEARVQVLSSGGVFLHPRDAILKVGLGLPFFYCEGEFVVDAPRGPTQVLVERGTEYTPGRVSLDMPECGTVAVDVVLDRWADLGARGWHPGNTHIHYDAQEDRPDERLRLDPRVEDLRLTAISVLQRRGLAYASNGYRPGMLSEFCTDHHLVECGEETRHNDRQDSIDGGYGHVMLLRLREFARPISRGYLVDDMDPDYPPLCYACDEAHRQGGVVIWCHNGRGMEAPVAAALGKLDAINLFDPYWMDPEYDLWYAMLNCGFHLPASTGSDWFMCSANRVYAYTGGPFRYDEWMAALQAGRTFITNGPALQLAANGAGPGDTLTLPPGGSIEVDLRWHSHYHVERAEIVWNGQVVASHGPADGALSGCWRCRVEVPSDGWLAARLSSSTRDSFFQPLFAHTSPVYALTGLPSAAREAAAAFFGERIERAIEWIRTSGRFVHDGQQREVEDLFARGLEVYRRLL